MQIPEKTSEPTQEPTVKQEPEMTVEPTQTPTATPDNSDNKVLVAYFSWSGTSERIAKILLSRQEQIHSVLKEQFRTAQTIRQQHMVMQE